MNSAETTQAGLLLRSASDIDQAVQLLSTAFSKPLAFDLVSAYCIWDPETGGLYLRTMESIPVLSESDLSRCLIQKQQGKFVIHCRLDDCYQKGDAYVYSVTLEKPNDHWIITDLKLNTSTL